MQFIQSSLMFKKKPRNEILPVYFKKSFYISRKVYSTYWIQIFSAGFKKCFCFQGLCKYFEDNDGAVLTCRNISMSIWKLDNYYYYFDSHDRNENGLITSRNFLLIFLSLQLNWKLKKKCKSK